MNGFSEAPSQPSEFMLDPRTSGANALFCTGKVPPWELHLEEACRADLHRHDVPKVSPLRGVRLLGCFGPKPSADITVRLCLIQNDRCVSVATGAYVEQALEHSTGIERYMSRIRANIL